MSVAAPLLGFGGFIIVWTSQYLVFAVPCGECARGCEQATGLCIGVCKLGWKGRGCSLKCSAQEDCRNPCRCSRACHCDPQLGTCTVDFCMAVGKHEIYPEDNIVPAVLLGTVSVIFFFAITAFCAMGRRAPHGFRGRILSHPCCAKCPRLRECLQNCGSSLGVPGFQLAAKDSLDTFCEEDERQAASYSQSLRQWRRNKGHVVGVKGETVPIKNTATSGYKWKKKWRERRERSRKKRQMKHAQRKLERETLNVPADDAKRGSIILPSISIGVGGAWQNSFNPVSFLQNLRRGSIRPDNGQGKAGNSPGDPSQSPSTQSLQGDTDPRDRANKPGRKAESSTDGRTSSVRVPPPSVTVSPPPPVLVSPPTIAISAAPVAVPAVAVSPVAVSAAPVVASPPSVTVSPPHVTVSAAQSEGSSMSKLGTTPLVSMGELADALGTRPT